MLALATAAGQKGHKCLFEVEIRYKPYPNPAWGSLKGVTFPTGFLIKVTELDKSGKAVKIKKTVFDDEQSQDETDFKVSGRIFDEADAMSAGDESDGE